MDIIITLKKSAQLLYTHPKLTFPFILNQIFFYSIVFGLSGLGIVYSIEYIQNQINDAIVYIIGGTILWFIISTLFSSWGYYQNSRYVNNKTISILKAFIPSLRYFFKLFTIRMLFFLIILIPFLFLIALSLSSFLINYYIGTITTVLSMSLLLVWIIFISVKLFYAEVRLFMEDSINYSTVYNLSEAYKFSKGKNSTIIVLFILIVMIHFFANSVLSNSGTNSILELVKGGEMILYFIIGGVFSILAGIIAGATSSFTNLTMMKSYLEFKKAGKKS